MDTHWDGDVIGGITRTELFEGMERWRTTGYGIDPNQTALRHYKQGRCHCCRCAGTHITTTLPPTAKD